MFTRCLAFALSTLALSFLSWGQTRGGGHGPATQSSSERPPFSLPSGNSNSNFPGSVPLTMANDEGKIEFRTETILVQVPIVVTDKSGNHIHGLTRENFHIFENGKEQKVSTFEEVISSNARLPVVASSPGEFSNLTLSEQQPRAVTVIALDTVNTPFLDQSAGRRELVKYLAGSIDSGQVLALMIITSHGLQIVQGLSGDSAKLSQVLKKASGELPAMHSTDMDAQADAAVGDIPDIAPPARESDPAAAIETFIERGDEIYSQFQQQNAIETTMNAFLGIAWSLSGVPGRKSLIWATGGFPFRISSPAVVPGGYLSRLYERTMGALAAAQISVYPVDIRGLVGTSPISDPSRSSVRSGPTLTRQIGNRAWLQDSSIDTLNEFADMTGGKAFYNTNDLGSSFRRAADDASSYYLAGYYLDTRNNHAGWRPLKVKVDRRDTEIRVRKGFFVTNATIHLELTRGSDLNYALVSPIDGTGVPITVKWLGTSGEGVKRTAEFQIHLPPNGVAITGSEGQNRFNFDVAATAFLDNGKSTHPAVVSETVTGSLTGAQMAVLREQGISFQNTLELGPGQYTVRVVVRDNATGKVGSVTAPLTVN